jgi:hypothetical protein
MAYADAIRAATATMEDVATLLEGFLIGNYSTIDQASNKNTTSTSFTAIAGTSASVTVASGEKVLLLASIACSQSTVGQWVGFSFYRDGGAIGNAKYFTCDVANTTGYNDVLSMCIIDSPSTGAHTYELYWKVSANTGYSDSQQLIILPFQYL